MLNLAVLLEDSAIEYPNREALVCGPLRVSYTELDTTVNRIANLLTGLGIGQGDNVVLACPNLPSFPAVYYAILKTGAVVVPINVLLKAEEIAYHLADSKASAFFSYEGTADLNIGEEAMAAFSSVDTCRYFFAMAADPTGNVSSIDAPSLGAAIRDQAPTFQTVATEASDTAVILYTSGTTGKPKGAELSHSSMLLNARLFDSMYTDHPHDVHLVTLPLFHTFAQTTQMNAGFYKRATLVLQPRFSATEALALMQSERVTYFAGVPTMYWDLLSADTSDVDLNQIRSDLRYSVSGGAPLPMEVLKGFEDKYGIQVLEGYGLSETSPIVAFNRHDRPSRPGSVGLPVWGVQLRIIDDEGADVAQGEPGELVVRGHCVMKGYYRRPDETATAIREGWLHTGDIARQDGDGYLYIVDRKKDLILRGGYNVYPREIEEMAMEHPAVSFVAVVGVPHMRHGEEVKAFVILEKGATLEADEFVEWCRNRMAGHKYPRLVEFCSDLPRNATGKILKRALI
ncbi:long-chain-fatty-acid--CoA ligase [Rhodococcus erythropolis]|uniref:long-chain-fatty-acid--CoA ligase n=1 Tax=Rhodococcus erythropolis TaxID=1833 RepID=UPI000A003A83|nr:long-chain fatty acid--CoA ligase [Rhodococcus erythropolis]ORI30983.1 long-chain-fatty-acid--CoA ligase [Rhodococcus erythropolis]